MWTPKNAARSCSCNYEFVLVLIHSVLFLCCLAPAYFCCQVGSKIAFMHADCLCEQSITGVNAEIRYGSLLTVDLGRQSEESDKGNKQDSGIGTCGINPAESVCLLFLPFQDLSPPLSLCRCLLHRPPFQLPCGAALQRYGVRQNHSADLAHLGLPQPILLLQLLPLPAAACPALFT